MKEGQVRALARAADTGAALDERLLAARQLVDNGFAAEALAALRDRPARETRKLVLYAKYVEQLGKSLDFEGKRPGPGRWETLDGAALDTTSETTGALLWTRPGVRRTALVFSNVGGSFGVLKGWHSIAQVHLAIRPLELNAIYLRDASRLVHFGGIRGLAADYPGCIAALKALLDGRGWTSVYALGDSAGGYAALRYGLDLEMRAVLSFSGQTSLDPADEANRHRMLEPVQNALPAYTVDLLPLYRARARRPRLLLCYGELNKSDAAHAQRMAELPETKLIPFEGFAWHSTLLEAVRRRSLDKLLGRLVGL